MLFHSARMPELLKSLNIPQNSNMAAMMTRTVAQCEAQQEQSKETRKCVTSLEDMTNFVATSLPEGKRITALERSSSASGRLTIIDKHVVILSLASSSKNT